MQIQSETAMTTGRRGQNTDSTPPWLQGKEPLYVEEAEYYKSRNLEQCYSDFVFVPLCVCFGIQIKLEQMAEKNNAN